MLDDYCQLFGFESGVAFDYYWVLALATGSLDPKLWTARHVCGCTIVQGSAGAVLRAGLLELVQPERITVLTVCVYICVSR